MCMYMQVLRYADNGVYVLKQVNIDGLSEREQRSAYNEVKILYEIMSPFVVTYYDSFIDGGTLNLVMEYCDLGDLQQALKRQATTGKPVPGKIRRGAAQRKEKANHLLIIFVLLLLPQNARSGGYSFKFYSDFMICTACEFYTEI